MCKYAAGSVLIVAILVTALSGCLSVTSGLPEPAPSAPPSASAVPAVTVATPEPSTTPAPTSTPAPTATPLPTATPTLVLGMRDTNEMIAARLVRVIDGTTIQVKVDGKEYVVRYLGIQPLGDGAATAAKNRQLVSGEALKLVRDVTDTDAEGRLLRYVYTRAYMVNAELARLGYARSLAIPPDTLYRELIDSMEQEARGAKRGLWARAGDTTSRATPAR